MEIFQFLLAHWLLSAAFIVILVLLLANEWRHRARGMIGLNAQQLVDLMNHSQGVVLDVRATVNYENGHILGAISMPRTEISKNISALNKYKNKSIILVCQHGMDSAKVGHLLRQHGFESLHYLVGGMEAWRTQSMPLAKK